jgi:chitodextrinase
MFYTEYSFFKNSTVTDGIAEEISLTTSLGAGKNAQGDISMNERDQSSQTMRVSFVTLDGEKVDTFLPITSDMEIGREVEIRYSNIEPAKAIKNTFLQLWIKSFLFAFISFFLLLVYMVIKP